MPRTAGAHNADRPWHNLDDDWMDRGACSGASEEVRTLFFSETDSNRVAARFAETQAKAICLDCDVQAECLTYALNGNVWGIWGGLTRRERIELIRKRRKASGRATVRRTAPRTTEP